MIDMNKRYIHLFGNARSGTTYLFHVLRNYICPWQEKHIYNQYSLNEPFSNYHNERFYQRHYEVAELHEKIELDTFSPLDLINDRLAFLENQTGPVVIKNHSNHLDDLKKTYPSSYRRFQNLYQDMYTIFLIRRNLFEITLSHLIAEETKQWNTYEKIDIANTNLKFDEYRFLHLLEKMTTNIQNSVANTHQIKYDEIIYYEDLSGISIEDFSKLKLSKTTDINMLEPIEVTQTSKAPDKRLLVVNYDELFEIADFRLKTWKNQGKLPNLEIEQCSIVGCDIISC